MTDKNFNQTMDNDYKDLADMFQNRYSYFKNNSELIPEPTVYTNKTDAKALMKKIQMYDFILTELIMYLDTHKLCQQALEMYRKYQKLWNDATMEYSDKYGPINPKMCKAEGKWDWVDGPWPWQREAD